jgi:hypothetical protein
MLRKATVRSKPESHAAPAPLKPQELPGVDPASFNALLRRTIGLSMHRQKASREELALALRELQPEARSKLRIVMTAGRDGLSLGSAHASVSSASPEPLDASELERAGDELGDYLARGYAIACATQFELDASLDRWSTSEKGELEERVWLRFGKQLAGSPPEEWECIGAVGAGGERLAHLYLRLGKAVWWSFGAVLDRPTPETVRKNGRTRSGRPSKLGPLRDVAARRCEPERRALRRALRAIRARVGKPLDV